MNSLKGINMRNFTFILKSIVLLCVLTFSTNAWGATLTGKVGIGSGKGSVYVEIYSKWWGASPVKTSETITSGSTSVDYRDVSIVNWAYCKFYATAANGYTFEAWYTNDACTSGKTTDNPKKTGDATGNRTDKYWAKFVPVTVKSVESAGTLNFTAPGNATTTAVFNVSNADATADFTYNVDGAGWEFVSWSYSNNKVKITVRYTCTETTSQGAHTASVTLTSKAEGGTSKTATVTANVDLTPTLSANKTSIDFGTYTLAKDTRKSNAVTLTFNVNAVKFEKTADASIAPFTTSWSSDHKTLTIYFEPTEVGDWTKELVVTVKNSQSPQLSATQTITIKGKAQRNTATINCTIADSYYVEDATLDLQALWTSNSDGDKTYSFEFTPSSTINAGATAPTLTSNRYLSLGQAGTVVLHLTQPQTTNFNAVDVTKTIIINKRANTITCDWGAWSKNMATDDGAFVNFSSDNNAEGAPAITVAQATGGDIATYYPESHAIYTSYNLGSATWTVAQAENYKYLGDSKTLTVNVVTVTEGCYVYGPEYPDNTASSVGEIVLPKAGSGDVLSFQMKKNQLAGNQATVTAYDANNVQLAQWKPEAASVFFYDDAADHTYTLPDGTKKVVFDRGGTINASDNPYINDIRITRKEWMTIQDVDGNTLPSLNLPINTINGEKTAVFYVDYSDCADEIKVASDSAHVTVSETAFDASAERKEIIVTYTSDIPEQIAATITVYTPSQNATITINAETEKQTPTLTWGSLYETEPVSLPLTFTDNAAATASNEAIVTYSVQAGEESIISIAADGRSFTVVGEGTAHLTATSAEMPLWKSVSETKVINATNKKIQHIVWNQNFTRAISVADEKELTAQVYVLNLATGEDEPNSARTVLIQYTCPADNGVIEMIDGTHFRVIGLGETTITASVAGNEEYEAATSITKIVRVRENQTGDCDPALMKEITDEIEFYAFSLSFPEVSHVVSLDHSQGTPDKLNFYVRGVSYNVVIEYYNEGIKVYQSTDGGATYETEALAYVYPEKNTTAYSETIQLSPEATHLKFVRPQGGRGYHYVGGITVTMMPMIEVENATINLGNIAAGSLYEGSIPVTYSDVKGDMTVTASNTTNGLTITDVIEADCGTRATVDLAFSVQPMTVGDWSNTITITDTLRNISVEVTLLATITQESQDIIWDPQTVITPDETPVLNAYATSGLTPVTYAVTSGSDIASIINGEVVISGLGTFTITVSQAGNISYAPVSKPWIFTVNGRYLFNGAIDDDWTKAGNWEIGEVPTASNDVIIASEVMVDSEEEVQSMTITPAGSVIVMPTGGLTIGAGGISGATKDNLILKADSAYESPTRGQTGFLRIHPNSAEPMPEATIELFTKVYTEMDENSDRNLISQWQYVGSPIAENPHARTVFVSNMIYYWNEGSGKWVNDRRNLKLEPFAGYLTNQYKDPRGKLVTFTGHLVPNDNVELDLVYTEDSPIAGTNVLANSYAAPIDITKIDTTDFSEGASATIYMFNTGSRQNIEDLDLLTKGVNENNAPGQYIGIPVGVSDELRGKFSLPTIIPSMQGFYVHTTKDATLTLDYNKIVWNAKHPNVPLRVKAHDEGQALGALKISVYADGLLDHLYMLESEQYDAAYENGYDARKMEDGEFNIFAIEGEDNLSVDATNSFIGTRVGVRTGEETMYTFFFSHLNSEKELALLDWETEQITEITENAEYTFFAEPNSTITDRFEIIEWDGSNKPGITTGVENVENGTKVHKFIKDNQLFILKNGVLYNATGVLVR